jgi:hypothetical protein
MTTPLEPWMRLGAIEWIISTWAEHKGFDTLVYAGLVAAFQHAKGSEFDLAQYQILGSERAVWSSLIRDTGINDKQKRTDFRRRKLPGLRQEWVETLDFFAPREGVTVLQWVRMARLYNQGTMDLVNKGVHEKGKQASSQCAQAARHFGLERQGLDLASESNLFRIRETPASKLPGDSGRQLMRSPTHEEHGMYSIIKQQSTWEMYVECTKSLEGASKALAIRCCFF